MPAEQGTFCTGLSEELGEWRVSAGHARRWWKEFVGL